MNVSPAINWHSRKLFIFNFLIPILFCLGSTNSWALFSTTLAPAPVSKAQQPADIDSTITNAKLRAELGSKSRWSVRSLINYQGATVNTPLSENRPDYRSASLDTANRVDMSADLAMKYNLDGGSSLNLGAGLSVFAPFHRTAEEATSRNSNFNISTPYLEYNKAYKRGSIQMVSAWKAYYATSNYDVEVLEKFGTLRFSQTLVSMLGTRVTGGLQFLLDGNFYVHQNGSYFPAPGVEVEKNNIIFGFFPFAEYALNDRYAFRTIFGYFQFKNTRINPEFKQLEPYQSVGLGISLNRDFYLYPNIQFAPKDIRSDRTNIGITANLNIF